METPRRMRRKESNGRSLNRRVSAKDCEQCLSCRPCLFHEHNRDYTQALSSDTLCTHKPTTAEHCPEIGTTPPRYKSPHGECAIRARTCVCSAPKYTHAKEYKDTKHTHTSGGITKSRHHTFTALLRWPKISWASMTRAA